MCLDVDRILSTAEGIYHQIISTPHLTDQIRIILGIPTVGARPEPQADSESEPEPEPEPQAGAANGNTVAYNPDMEEVMYQIGLDMNF